MVCLESGYIPRDRQSTKTETRRSRLREKSSSIKDTE